MKEAMRSKVQVSRVTANCPRTAVESTISFREALARGDGWALQAAAAPTSFFYPCCPSFGNPGGQKPEEGAKDSAMASPKCRRRSEFQKAALLAHPLNNHIAPILQNKECSGCSLWLSENHTTHALFKAPRCFSWLREFLCNAPRCIVPQDLELPEAWQGPSPTPRKQ